MSSTEELRNLAQQIANDPDKIHDLAPDTILAVRKYLNPLGNVITAKKTYANISLVNWKEKWLRRLITTSLIAYLYRLLEEYEPTADLEKETARYNVLISSCADPEKLHQLKLDHEKRIMQITTNTKNIIRTFLDRNFDYNPDVHLRGAHTENPKDPERISKAAGISHANAASAQAESIEARLKSKPDAVYSYLKEHLLETYQHAKEATNIIKSSLTTLLTTDMNIADIQGILLKKYKSLSSIVEDMGNIARPIAAAETLKGWIINPPADVYHQFDRYINNHYEQLRDIVQSLYTEKPDFEYAAILYDAFDTAEAARNHRIQHEKEFRTEVFTIENAAVTLIGPFMENRQRIDFYNKNTDVMKIMMEQLEADHKLGKDLMEKQVRQKKKKNIEEAGPDDPALAQYAKTMNVVQELGARKILTHEDQAKLSAAHTELKELREDYEVPDDAIQVDMFYPQKGADGQTILTKSKFYTQAEAPLHLQDNSPYVDKYQPKRAEGESLINAYKTKTIIDKNGKKIDITVRTTD